MITSGLFFSYGSQSDLDYLTRNLMESTLDEVVLAVGGDVRLPPNSDTAGKEKLSFILEKPRLGKTQSYNRAIARTHGDVTFIVSGDVRFHAEVFSDCVSRLVNFGDMLIPRVVHPRATSFSTLIGGVMWDIHDSFMEYMSSRSRFFCGGEFQAIKGPKPIERIDAVNDDEFLCHQVFGSGRRIVYARDITVTNRMPDKLISLMKQRIRVNYGHLQFRAEKRMHSSISLMGWKNVGDIFRIMLLHARRYWLDVMILPMAALFESVSYAVARRDFHNGVSHSIWEIPAPAIKEDDDTANP